MRVPFRATKCTLALFLLACSGDEMVGTLRSGVWAPEASDLPYFAIIDWPNEGGSCNTGQCSAFVLDEHWVATAYHCVVYYKKTIDVYVPALKRSYASAYYVIPNEEPRAFSPSLMAQRKAETLALLYVPESLHLQRYPQLHSDFVPKDRIAELRFAPYGLTHGKTSKAQSSRSAWISKVKMKCTSINSEDSLLECEEAVHHGDSGGPLNERDPNGNSTDFVVAFTSGGAGGITRPVFKSNYFTAISSRLVESAKDGRRFDLSLER